MGSRKVVEAKYLSGDERTVPGKKSKCWIFLGRNLQQEMVLHQVCGQSVNGDTAWRFCSLTRPVFTPHVRHQALGPPASHTILTFRKEPRLSTRGRVQLLATHSAAPAIQNPPTRTHERPGDCAFWGATTLSVTSPYVCRSFSSAFHPGAPPAAMIQAASVPSHKTEKLHSTVSPPSAPDILR